MDPDWIDFGPAVVICPPEHLSVQYLPYDQYRIQ